MVITVIYSCLLGNLKTKIFSSNVTEMLTTIRRHVKHKNYNLFIYLCSYFPWNIVNSDFGHVLVSSLSPENMLGPLNVIKSYGPYNIVNSDYPRIF